MKKALTLLTALVMLFGLTACDKAVKQDDSQTQSEKKPVEVSSDTEGPQGTTVWFSYDNLSLEISHVYEILPVQMTDDGGTVVDYTIYVCGPDAQVTVLEAGMDSGEYAEDGQPHPQFGLVTVPSYSPNRITTEMVGQPMKVAQLAGVSHLESSLYLARFVTVPPADSGVPYDVNGNSTLESWEFPIPTGEVFGLTGRDAQLYTAAARKKAAEMTPRLGTDSADLMLPMISVYGEYPGENGDTHYICGYGEQYYYSLGIDPSQMTSNRQGGGGGVARLTLSADGVLTEVLETQDGIDNTPRIQEICGPLTELAEQLNNGTAQARSLNPADADDTLQAYLNYFFPSTNR